MTHANVQEALVAILDELPAIGKNQRAPAKMGGYGFRGIDDVLNALNPLLGKHGVFFTPEVLERIDGQFTNSGGGISWTVKLKVEYTFHHISATECVSTTVWGEAHDSGDKATQKALTAAQKSMLFQVFAINTADQADSDSERHEAEEAVPERPFISGMNVKAFIDRCAEAGLKPTEIDTIVLGATDGRTKEATEIYADEVPSLRKAFDSYSALIAGQMGQLDHPDTNVPWILTSEKPGKKVAKGVGPSTEGVVDVETQGELV